jgi:hypothetical protein
MAKLLYKPTNRIHETAWLIEHSNDLLKKAIRQKDSSKIH